MANVSLVDGHIENAEHCVCCGRVIPEGRQHCIICGEIPKKKRQIDRIKNMSVKEMTIFFNNTSLCDRCIFDYARDCAMVQQDCYLGVQQWLESEVTE